MRPENRYLLALYASPRRRGNTSLLLDSLVEGAGEAGVEAVSFRVAEMDIRPCRGCEACSRDGECVQRDDMQAIYPHLERAGAVALAAPIFSMHICAQAKALIDRCQRFWALTYVLGKHPVDDGLAARRRGLFISCCGRDAPETFECTRPTVAYFFHVIRVKDWDSQTYAGVDAAGEIRKVTGALQRAAGWGRSLRDWGSGAP
ncbi:flavodoxin family protein [Candidatus Solincola tengchongensis]|uniref:flavodoxin family protein n=1 Tax=Candidatus Solincola tengchongensis TaxID=2900693 RepID=UPI00257FC598|nr:flavodoxin family protein [Candidatus Solincola tengchongensis]